MFMASVESFTEIKCFKDKETIQIRSNLDVHPWEVFKTQVYKNINESILACLEFLDWVNTSNYSIKINVKHVSPISSFYLKLQRRSPT